MSLLSHPATWLALLLPALWLALARLERRAAAQRRALLGPREARLGAPTPAGRLASARLLFVLGLACGLLALAQPRPRAGAAATPWRGVDLVLALDVSRSMLARDLAPDRLGRAVREIEALAGAATGDRLGLVLFAGEARVRVPLTRDLVAVARVAASARPEDVLRGGTDLAAALEAAGSLAAGGAEGQGAVLLLTDGEDHAGQGAAAAARLRDRGIVVHVLGVGSEAGARIPVAREGGGEQYLRDGGGREVLTRRDDASLARVARSGGGAYARLQGEAPLLPALHQREVRPRLQAQHAALGRAATDDVTPWLVLAALLALAGDLLLGHAKAARPAAAPRTPPATRRAAAPVVGALLVTLLLPGCGRMQEARDLAAGGQHAAALALLEQDLARAGARAPAALHANLGLCALRLGQVERARAAFAAAEAAGGPAYARLATFLRGHAAFVASRDLEQQSRRPGADPALLEGALMRAEDALAAFRLASTQGPDWPEARRNLERALLRLESLREQRRTGSPGNATPRLRPGPAGSEASDPAAAPAPAGPGRPSSPTMPPPTPGAGAQADEGARVVTAGLPDSELRLLGEVLRRKAAERDAARQGQRARASARVDKDW